MKLIKPLLLVFVLLLLLAKGTLSGSTVYEGTGQSKDTLREQLKPIDLADIPIKSAELKIKTRNEIQDLISDKAIRELKQKNALALASIDPALLVAIDADDVSKNIRFLESRRVELLQEAANIEGQKKTISELINQLEQSKIELTRELKIWKKTRTKLERDSLIFALPPKVNETIQFLDSTLVLIGVKSTALLQILDNTISTGALIENQIEKTHELINTRQAHAFERDHPGFFRLNFTTNYFAEIAASYQQFVKTDLAELFTYLKNQSGSTFFALVIFVSLLYLFRVIRRKVTFSETGYGVFYKQMLQKMLSHAISASIILTLFVSLFIFPARPAIFREISFYIMAFPLIHVLRILLHQRYHLYIYAFGVLILFYMLLLLFPTGTVSYRMLLLFISAAEMTLLSLFLLRFDRKHELEKREKRTIYSFVFLHLALAVTGFFSNMAGRITLTEIVQSAVFFNIFNGVALFITALLINALIITGIDTRRGQRINVFRLNGELIKKKSSYLLNFLAVLFWVILVLRNFRMSDIVFGAIGNMLSYPISIGSATFSLDVIVIFFIVIYISVVFAQIIRSLLEEDVLNRFSLSKGLPHTIAMLVKYSLITAGFFLAVNAAGIPVDKLTIILGAMSVGIGFGLQNIFNNLVSGLILLFERPIQLGDTVQVGQLTGNVKTIGLRSSNIKTFDGAEVIVPNGQLISNEVINWTLSDQERRIEILVGVAYESDPQQVHSLLKSILEKHTDVLHNPAPAVFFSALGESSLDFTLLFWIADYNEGRRIKSEILFAVFAVLKENNIEIPFPQRDLHLRSVSAEAVFRKSE